MEKIGYIEKNSITLINGLNVIKNLDELIIKYNDRNLVETRNDVVQPICAGVIISKTNKVLVVNKNSKSTGEKSPEKNKTLLYIGGHLDISDISKSNIETFMNGMKREIKEEIDLTIDDYSIQNLIFTYTPNSEKSARHLGIIFPVFIENDFDLSFTDGKCKFVDISSVYNITNLESWSEIILQEVISKLELNQHL